MLTPLHNRIRHLLHKRPARPTVELSERPRVRAPAEIASLPQFDGFPYVLSRIVPALYHVIPVPADAPLESLLRILAAQVKANQFDACLAVSSRKAIFNFADGSTAHADAAPRGGTLVAGKLAPPVAFLHTTELERRSSLLQAFVRGQTRVGMMFGDLTKGGRLVDGFELRRYEGRTPEGAPQGLRRCDTCGEFRGKCLDPSAEFRSRLMTVDCLCANHNRCARCGALLYGRRLNANYYDLADDAIWHVPGFCAFRHECR